VPQPPNGRVFWGHRVKRRGYRCRYHPIVRSIGVTRSIAEPIAESTPG
jgi:hypothetical protein